MTCHCCKTGANGTREHDELAPGFVSFRGSERRFKSCWNHLQNYLNAHSDFKYEEGEEVTYGSDHQAS